jgi:hypothetical protein
MTDRDKLERLRARFADRGAFDAQDPTLAQAAQAVQKAGGKRSLPYSGIPTFLGLPHTENLADLDIAVVGIPMDLGVSTAVARDLVRARCATLSGSALTTLPFAMFRAAWFALRM